MTKKTLKRIQAIRTELETIQTELTLEGEREVSAAVQSAQRELETPGILIATQRAELDYGEPTSDPENT